MNTALHKRLFTADHLRTPLINQPHSSQYTRVLRCWLPAITYNEIMATQNPALEILFLYQQPNANNMQISFAEPHFFDDTEHFEVSIDYHTDELEKPA